MIHLVYAIGDSIGTPHAITNELARRLALSYDLKIYDWADAASITPSEGDVLIGHPHPSRNTIYRNSFRKTKWGKRIVMSPFAHAMPEYIAFLDPFVTEADRYLAICGKYWMDTIAESVTSHWLPKMTRMDLGVNTEHFPPVKTAFGSEGQRRFLYIGHTSDNKGCDYLAELADANPDLHIGWIGSGRMPSRRIIAHGMHNFAEQRSRDLVATYDFLLTCGRSDANPTTVLEAAAWGLVPVCTPQSGYYDEDWLVNVPLDDVREASLILNRLNALPETELFAYQRRARAAIARHYNWDRFARQVIDSIETAGTEPVVDLSALSGYSANRWALRRMEVRRRVRGAASRASTNLLHPVGRLVARWRNAV